MKGYVTHLAQNPLQLPSFPWSKSQNPYSDWRPLWSGILSPLPLFPRIVLLDHSDPVTVTPSLFWNTSNKLVPHSLFAVSCAWNAVPQISHGSLSELLQVPARGSFTSAKPPLTPPFYIANYLPGRSLYCSSFVPLRKCKLHKTSDPCLFCLIRKTT